MLSSSRGSSPDSTSSSFTHPSPKLSPHTVSTRITDLPESTIAVPKVLQCGFREYEIGEQIGAGSTASVWLAKNALTGEWVACKIVNKHLVSSSRIDCIRCEATTLRRLHHTNVVHYLDTYEDNDFIVVIVELVEGGELGTWARNNTLSEASVAAIFTQIVSALQYLHSHNVAHCDIKTENVLVDISGAVKLIDFENSATIEWTPFTRSSPAYTPPEAFGDEICSPIAVDIWGLGVSLFEVMSGSLPFHAVSFDDLRRLIKVGDFNMPPSFSADLRDLIRQILCPAEIRISLDDLAAHPWFSTASSTPSPYTSPVLAPMPVPSMSTHLQRQLDLEREMEKEGENWYC